MIRPAGLLLPLFLATACRPRDPSRPSGSSRSALDSLVVLGEQIYRREEYDSARQFLGWLSERARVSGDSLGEARALTWLGLANWRMSRYPQARDALNRSLTLKLALGLDRELWRSYNGLGLVAWNEGRHADALEHFAAATSAARRVDDTVAIGSTAGNVALVRTELGDFAAARRGFLEAQRIGRTTGNARVEGNALTNLGMLDVRIGDPTAALLHLDEARKLYRSVEYATGEQSALGQLGTAYAARGEPTKALAALDSALAIARELGLQQEEVSHLEAMAEQYRVAGDYRKALELYGRARDVNRDLGAQVELGVDLRSEAEIHIQLGDLGLARRYAGDALATHRRVAARVEELADELLLADIVDRAGHREDADRRLTAASQRAHAIDTRIARVSASLAEARIADRRGESRRVLTSLAATAGDLDAGGYDIEWEAHALRSRALARLGRLEQAAAEGRFAMAAVERVRGSYGSGLLRTSYIADRSAVYAELAGVLERLGRMEEAFEVSDAARGRALLERRAEVAGHAMESVEQRAELLAEIGGLVTQVGQFARQYDLTRPYVRANLDTLDSHLTRARDEFERLVAREEDVASDAALLGVTPTKTAIVEGSLGRDEALIEYLVSPGGVSGFVVTSERVTPFRSALTPVSLEAKVRLARGLLAQPGGAVENVLESLHQALIAPAGLPRGARRLIIVPHGVLMYLPFGALREPRTGLYLAETYSIQYVPSAGALPELRRRDRGRRPSAQAVVFAPFPDRLPASADEADALRHTARAQVRLGPRATEARFREALKGGGVVHVATHGVLNTGNPLFSRIEFAAQPGTDPSDDGRLEVHELLRVRITSPLVFLSGCETGLGPAGASPFVRGDDFATLSQAFLFGGAANVVATLWSIEDAGAAVFAGRFYEHLGGSSPVEALARAQRDLLGDSRYRDPFYWAAYTTSGGGGWVQEWAPVSVRQ